MKRRTARTLIGILALVCFALVSSAVYPLTTVEPHAATPQSERFTVSDADAFSASGRIVVEGDVRLAFDGVVTDDGSWYQTVVAPNLTSEEYRPSPDGPIYYRLTVAREDHAERLREQISEDENSRLHRADRDGDHVVYLVEENTTERQEPVSGTASVFVRNLYAATYRKTASDSSAVSVYEPQAGWYDGGVRYRITDAAGTVRTDAETHAVRSANVSWEVTRPSGSYAAYLLARLTSEQPRTHRTTFEFTPGDPDLQRPAWVRTIESES